MRHTDEGGTSGVNLQELASFKAFVAEAADRREPPATFTRAA